MTDANTMIMDIQVIGTTRVKTSTIVFEEQLYVSAAAVDQSLYSSYFGPPSCQWQVRFSLVFDDMNRLCNMSGYLAPVKSQFEESLGNQWDRAISTFQLNIYNPITQQLMVSKSWTGGFNFAEFNSLAGWESLFEETLTEMIDTFTFKVEVTWDPALLNEYTGLGKAKAALNSSSVNISQLEQQLEAAFAAKLQYIEEKQTLTGYIDRLTTQLQELQVKSVKQDEALKELDLLRQRNNLITTELAAVRDEQRSHHVREIVFASAKERLANLRLSITREEFNSQPLEQGLEYQLESCQAELAEMRHEKAQLDLKLAQALSELHFVNRSNKDNVLMAPIVSHDDTYGSEEIQTVDPIERIGQAIETGRNECTLGRAAIEELNSKIQVMSIKQGTKSEKAGLIADISMLQCGLDVASATMYEAAESLHLLEDKSEFDTIQLDLEDVRRKLVDIKNGLEMSINGILSYRKQSGVSHNGGEIGLPPKSINGSIQSFIGTPASVSRTPALPITKSPAKPGSRTPLQKSNTLAFEDDMTQQDESVAPGDLKKISNRIDSIVDLIKNSFIPNGQVNWSVDEIESWTPAEDQNSKLDAQQLQILLKELKQNQNGKMYSIFYILGSLLSIFFITYATVFVICNPNQSSTALSTYQPACNSVILPTWNSAQTQWHKLCEKMILDIIPTTFKKVKVATRKLKRIAKAKFVDQSKRDRDQRKSSKSNDFEFETVLEHHPKTVDKKGNRESEYAITSSKKSSSSSSDTDAPTIVSSTRSKSKGSRHTSNTIRSVTNIPSVDSKINDKIVQQTVIQSPVIQSTEIVSDLIKPEVDIPISTSEIVENKSDSITPSQISTEINDLPSTSITDVDNGEEEIDQDPVSYHAEHVDLNHLVQDAVTSDSWTESNVVYDTLVDPTDTVQDVETDIIQIDELYIETKEVQDDVSISSTATTQAQSVEITTTQAQSVEITPVDDHHNTSVDPVNEDILSSLPDSDTSVADIIQPPTETVESTYTSDSLESNTVLESIKEPTSSIESTSIETTINTLINEKEVKTAIDEVADNFNISEKETKTIAEESSSLPASTGGSELKESLTYDNLEESEASVTNSNLESFDKETITDNELNDTTVNEDQNVESMGDQNDSDNEYFEGNDLDGGVTANEEEDNTTVMEQTSTVSQSVDLELEAKIQQSTDIDDDGVIVEDDISNLVVIPDSEEGIFTILPYTDEQNLTDAENLKGNVIDEAGNRFLFLTSLEEVEVGEKAIQPTTVISESIPSEGAGALPEDVTEESISN
ncbi:hypothetical protein BC833DRAFT_49643 [Globomyces pollinis-pini]|nr:hypothetical protein BC833DRAFT_49643 [Globomyces pollinis-pini]